MKLNSLFQKDINRSIEGVIKADDDASLLTEVEEYVLTNEVSKRLESFLDAYNNYDGANGVWISGFFGSGKSHLLKMLALLLEGHEVEGESSIDLFLPKCADNEILRGDLKRAVSIPSKSILFNIDQKADVISKEQVDALLAVFVKVFDEACGYYGKQGYIAQFERELDQDGLLVKFREKFKSLADMEWSEGRKRVSRIASLADQAYSESVGESVSDVLDRYRGDYRVSIEDFADQVNEYINRQASDFRLNFFVDEVGQYIAENVKLMTNLQTIAESLATKCRGRAWVIVTAQEDMNSVVGEMTQQQGNDFTKIQARFANRMKLTSADVAEVIQKRLLLKNEAGVEHLSGIYHKQSNNFGTLFDFADGSQSHRNFLDRDHFIHTYPFIPYQFTLFQSAIQNLSIHSAFEGRHSSVGERSMLGVFQQVAMHIANEDVGQLATFDLMFEGIRTALKAQMQRSIQVAERNLDNPFAIRVLKALFLVKYVKEFKATVRNICVLMQHGFDIDQQKLRNDVEEALSLLEQQTYIQRNGEYFQFLTETEKDIEQEIKATDVDNRDVEDELANVIFDYIIKDRKIRYDDNKQDYSFSRKLDGRLLNRESELSIHVISPFYEHSGNHKTLQMQSMGQDEIVIALPSDDRLIRDLLMFKRTDKYIKQNSSITQDSEVKKILPEKGIQNQERYNDIKMRAGKLISEATIFSNGSELGIREGGDPRSRVISAFYELIRVAYPNLKMLMGIAYSENDIGRYLTTTGTLISDEDQQLNEAEHEVIAFIQSNQRGGTRTTLKSLVENFERKPYGWYLAASLCTVAKLCARTKIEVRSDGNILEDNELVRALRNTHTQGNIILEPQVEFTAGQVRKLKEFYEDFFDAPPKANEAKILGKETADKLQQILHELEKLAAEKSQLPFLNVLNQPIEQIRKVSGKPYPFYLTELGSNADALVDMKEDILDPVRRFMGGSMKAVYNEVRTFIQNEQHNFADIDGDEANQIKVLLDNVDCYKGDGIQQAKSLMDSIKKKIAVLLADEKQKAITDVEKMRTSMEKMDEFSKISSEEQADFLRSFEDISQKINALSLIAVIRNELRRFEEMEYSRLLSNLVMLAQPKPVSQPSPATTEDNQGDDGKGVNEPPAKPEPRIEIMNIHSLMFDAEKTLLTSVEDVDAYIEKLREAMLKEIESGKRMKV